MDKHRLKNIEFNNVTKRFVVWVEGKYIGGFNDKNDAIKKEMNGYQNEKKTNNNNLKPQIGAFLLLFCGGLRGCGRWWWWVNWF